jgi:FkbM family methyltransferase
MMARPREFLKALVGGTCSARVQHRVRSFYLTRRVVAGLEFHEPEMFGLKKLIRPGDSVADIGANVGAYTKELSSLVGDEGCVYAFEPVWANYDILETVIRKAKLSNVSRFRIALGSKTEEREMVIPDLGGFTGYYWARFARPGERGERVTVSALDELWGATIPRLDFIKCDVEGSELEVLKGGSALVRSQRPAWLLEVSRETSGDVFASLKGWGYKAFVYRGRLIETQGYRDKEFSNYFFLHPESDVWGRWQCD